MNVLIGTTRSWAITHSVGLGSLGVVHRLLLGRRGTESRVQSY
jgi:hypothetical protein